MDNSTINNFNDIDWNNYMALVDANNFYVSCERVFRPWLNGCPVVVLSNNDDIIISRSNEAKALGIEMATPVFEIKDLIKRHNVEMFSSNYELYGDMSRRIMTVLSHFVEEMEVYSIDEAFLNLHGYKGYDLSEYGRKIVDTVKKGTGIPASIGIGPTKTLAKLANRYAKKHPECNNAYLIDNREKLIETLKATPVSGIWGIGRQHNKFLKGYGVETAYDFTQQPEKWVRKNMTVVGERTYMELCGIPCIGAEEPEVPRKQICTSRSFGEIQTEYAPVSEAVANFAVICSQKLRKQKSCATALMVMLRTVGFYNKTHAYSSYVIQLPTATNATTEIVRHALIALKKIFQPGNRYRKAGVIIVGMEQENAIQMNMFDTTDYSKHARLDSVLDKWNSGFNNCKIILASQGTERKWKLKCEKCSPCYTTRLKDLITVSY